MTDIDRYKLLAGPYVEPTLGVGDRTICIYRDCEVVITRWTDAPIPWPRCRALHRRGGSGLLVNDELLRAIRTESVEAIMHWWKIGSHAVWNWRKAFGVKQWGTEGSQRLHRQLSEAGAKVMRGVKLSEEQLKQCRQTAIALGYKPTGRWDEDGWKPEQLALLGTMPDDVLAAKMGRTAEAVRIMRTRLGIPTALDRRTRQQEQRE